MIEESRIGCCLPPARMTVEAGLHGGLVEIGVVA
ncbi:MAG: hypothetical protein JWR14_7181 [Caballeronia sp.]|jgi:hypothetical protein|nr:hypothetical protein [Caballeronia sp.]